LHVKPTDGYEEKKRKEEEEMGAFHPSSFLL
jgi:hypothetical protein